MSFLEFLGLESLLNNEVGSDSAAGGIITVIGMIAWLIMIIFGGTMVDQSIVVFNLLVAILFWVKTIIDLIKTIKEKRWGKNKFETIMNIIPIILIIVSFIYGYGSTYHALLFNFNYTPIASGIAYTLLPLIIFNAIKILINKKEKKILKRLTNLLKYIKYIVISFIIAFIIGEIITLILFWTDNTDIYDYVAYYQDNTVKELRENWKYSNVNDCIEKNLNNYAKDVISDYNKNSVNKNDGALSDFLAQNTPYGEEYSKYKITIKRNAKKVDEKIYIFSYVDEETKKQIFYKYDYNDYTFENISQTEYEQLTKK